MYECPTSTPAPPTKALKYIKQYVAIFLAMPPADLDWKIDLPNKLDK